MDPIVADELTSLEAEAARHWWIHIVAGVLWILFGWVVLSFDDTTVWAVAVFVGFGLTGVLDLVVAITTRGENDMWWLQLTLGIAQIVIGFWAIGYAGRSIALLVVWVGATALARGISALIVGFGLHGADKQLRRQMAA